MNADHGNGKLPLPGEMGYVRLKRPDGGRNQTVYRHADLSDRVIKAFYAVYKELGSGFVESVYANALTLELHSMGLAFERESSIKVFYQERLVGDFKAEFVIEGKILVELKAVSKLGTEHETQILNYLRASDIEVGLLLNFGPKPEIRRFAYDNQRKKRGRSS